MKFSRSDPARSTSESVAVLASVIGKVICKIEWLRDDLSLQAVYATVRLASDFLRR